MTKIFDFLAMRPHSMKTTPFSLKLILYRSAKLAQFIRVKINYIDAVLVDCSVCACGCEIMKTRCSLSRDQLRRCGGEQSEKMSQHHALIA